MRRHGEGEAKPSHCDVEAGEAEERPKGGPRWRLVKPTWRWSLPVGLVVTLGLFLISIKAELGFGYVLAQCVFKAYHPLDEYTKSGHSYPSVSAILDNATKGWGSIDFPTDKATLHNYTRIYDVLLAPYQHTAKNILEIGIKKGGSMKLWREFFDPSAFIYGMDIDPSCPTFTRDAHMKSLILDTNVKKDVLAAVGDLRFDIIVDDGCHTNTCIWNSWKALFPLLEPHGVYLVEDYPKFRVESVHKHYYPRNKSVEIYVIEDSFADEVLLAMVHPTSWILDPEIFDRMTWIEARDVGPKGGGRARSIKRRRDRREGREGVRR